MILVRQLVPLRLFDRPAKRLVWSKNFERTSPCSLSEVLTKVNVMCYLGRENDPAVRNECPPQ